MAPSVAWLDQVRTADAVSVGGKAANLGELLGQGFPVPPGFVVSAEAYESAVASLDLAGELRLLQEAGPAEVDERCAVIRSRIEECSLAAPLKRAVREAHRRLADSHAGPLLCAVRSSATAEDLGAASFAGQHGTYYYVDEPSLLRMLRLCWASLWSPHAVRYRASHGIEHAAVSMAVVVQEMVASEVSGVAFTANPVTGARDELTIESSWGMGAAIVDGRVTPDRYVVARDGLRLRSRRIADKRCRVASQLEPGQTGRLEEVPHDLRRRETLTPGELRTVADWSLRCESHFGRPQDVEWAFHDSRFFLLQSRPITVLGGAQVGRGVGGQYVLFKPVAENFTDPLTPLTQDMLGTVRPPGFRMVDGWVYVDLAFLARWLPLRASADELADLLYAGSREAPPGIRLSLGRLAALAPVGLLLYLSLAVLLARTRALPDVALESYRALCRKIEQDPRYGFENSVLRLWLAPRLLDPIGHMAVFANASAARGFAWLAVLRLLLRRWAPGLRAGADVLLGSGSEGVLSAEMGRAIGALADCAAAETRVRETLLRHPPARAFAELKREDRAADFLKQLDRFLARHGHRAIKEFELRSPRWEEDPAAVLGMVRNHLLADANLPDANLQEKRPTANLSQEGGRAEHRRKTAAERAAEHARKAAAARADVERELEQRLAGLPLERRLGLRLRLIRYAADRLRYYYKLRENTRFYHCMLPGVVRRKALRLEAELLRHGRLKCKEDVFFLHFHELAALQAGRLAWPDVEDRVRERRIEHVRRGRLSPPKTIGLVLAERAASLEREAPEELPAPVEPASKQVGDPASLLVGQSASPGRYEGRARVILDPSLDPELMPGEVLVAPFTDPAWTPLFLTAGAAVVEVGSYLSHAGTVAREFGMPCVVDVADATQRIWSGDRIAVDGDRGHVRILERGARA